MRQNMKEIAAAGVAVATEKGGGGIDYAPHKKRAGDLDVGTAKD